MNLISTGKANASRIKRLALKHKYRSYNNTHEKIIILTWLYQKRLAQAELKTCQIVDSCQSLVSETLHTFFETKKKKAAPVIEEMLSGKLLNYSDLGRLISDEEISNVVDQASSILKMELKKHFLNVLVEPVLKIEPLGPANLNELFNAINTWKETKHSSVVWSEFLNRCNSRVWSNVLEKTIQFEILAKGLDQVDIGSLLLKNFGIDADLEQREFIKGLVLRINGLIDFIKFNITCQINSQIAEIIYTIHDKLNNNPIENKISLLKDKSTQVKLYQNG